MGLFKRIFDNDYKELRKFEKKADKVLELESSMQALSDDELKAKTEEFKEKIKDGAELDSILVEAFAVVREASTRVLGMTPFKVQIMGAIAMHEGNIAEMKTGEGKTLTSTLTAYLNALGGKGVHIITVNEYLASRDAEEMGELFKWLGLSVGLNLRELSNKDKQTQYDCDIMYSTNSEIGFDYLRDNMVVYKEEMVAQRGLNYAIIDEVDSILIDEARTPLIISGGMKRTQNLYKQADNFVRTLRQDVDYELDIKSKTVRLTDEGMHSGESFFGINSLYDNEHAGLLHRVQNAMRANFVMKRDFDYMVQENEVLIVDQFTGRVLQGRQYSEGLHQALEAKENVEIKKETQTLATITYQNLFRMYNKLSGMTGTAKTEEEEFQKTYNMFVIPVPTNKPIMRDDVIDLIFQTKKAKYSALVADVLDRYQKGQPVLIGTVAVETSEYISNLLTKNGVKHEVLNAKNHFREGEIIANAGQIGAVTIATNMAGRGTDIKLGQGVKELGGLAVLGTERHESRRIDNQLRGRSGRQGDPGYSRFYVSLEDELVRRFAPERMDGLLSRLVTDDAPLESKMFSRMIEGAQKRVEGQNFDSRKTVLEYDDVMRMQRETIYKQRKEVLVSEDVEEIALDIIDNAIDRKIKQAMSGIKNPTNGDIDKLMQTLTGSIFSPEALSAEKLYGKKIEDIEDICIDLGESIFQEKKEIFEEDKYQEFIRVVLLKTVDRYWMEQIDAMDGLRKGIHYRSYAQINPLREYQEAGFLMFENLITNIENEAARILINAKIERNLEREQVAKPISASDGKEPIKNKPIVKKDEKIGRNDLCSCGSGRKYKHCCGK